MAQTTIFTKNLEVFLFGFIPITEGGIIQYIKTRVLDPAGWDAPLKAPNFLFNVPGCSDYFDSRGWENTISPIKTLVHTRSFHNDDHSVVDTRITIANLTEETGVFFTTFANTLFPENLEQDLPEEIQGVSFRVRLAKWDCIYRDNFDNYKVRRKRGVKNTINF
jgi:hypothetical protein